MCICYDSIQVWLLEMNCNPALHTNCEVLKEVVPSTVMETLGENLHCELAVAIMFINIRWNQILCSLILGAAEIMSIYHYASCFSDLVIEIFNKCRCGLKLLPLNSQKDFVLLHCGDTTGVSFTKQRNGTAGCPRTACLESRSSSKKT